MEDKIKVLFEQGRDLGEKRKAYGIRLKEAQSQGKETAAQHIAAEAISNSFFFNIKLFIICYFFHCV